jgi:hypothetical protein
MASERLPVQLAARVLGVSESGYYEWRGRAPSARAIRHAWLTDLIRQVPPAPAAPTARGGSAPSWSWAAASRSATGLRVFGFRTLSG